jgi:hypothetical protein
LHQLSGIGHFLFHRLLTRFDSQIEQKYTYEQESKMAVKQKLTEKFTIPSFQNLL